MPTSPILGSDYVGASRNVAYNRAINLMAELVDTKDGKAVGAMYVVPGYSLFMAVGAGPIRCLYQSSTGPLYVVSGNGVYSVTTAGAVTRIGSLATQSGPVKIVDNGASNQLLIVDGSAWCYNSSTSAFTQVLPEQINIIPTTVGFQDGAAFVNSSGTNQWYQSNLGDFSTWNGLNFSSADASPDNILSVGSIHREAWLFKQWTTEVWVNAGLNGFVFQRLQGVLIPAGIVAPYSLARLGDSWLWLGQDDQGSGVVFQTSGYQARAISTNYVARTIQGFARMDDAIAWVEQESEHFLYWLTFPTANMTFVYDASTQLWHERAEFVNGQFNRSAANAYTFSNGRRLIGDYANGNIYQLSESAYSNNGAVRKWLRTWRALPPNRTSEDAIIFNSLQIDMETGIEVPAGTDPQYMLRWSDDGGHTWSNERWRGRNKTGQTSSRVIYQRLGATKRGGVYDRVFELSGTDPAPVALINAYVDAT